MFDNIQKVRFNDANNIYLSMSEQMPKQESKNLVGNPLEQVQGYFDLAIKSMRESFSKIGEQIVTSLGFLKGSGKDAQKSFENMPKA